ncbi:unnamed protein product [Linum trigynum]|uniref:DUF6821 domain-containing protein n=1 Tax=Linum trigynum TaxID=586398 RepID=A0AAV2D445_9ROSI
MEGGEGSLEFQDWEVLAHSDTEAVVISSPVSVENPRSFEEIEADSGGMIRLDYFSIGNDSMFDKSVVASAAGEVESSVESDNPSWIDPAIDNRFEGKNSVGFWSDSGSDRSDDRKVGDFDVRNELGAEKLAKSEEMEAKGVDGREFDQLVGELSSCEAKSESGFEENVKTRQLGFEEIEEKLGKEKDMTKFWSDSGGDGLVLGSEVLSEEATRGGNAPVEENSGVVEAGEGKLGVGDEGKKQPVVWWKVPFELLKCCVFRVSPVWTFSMAAALMGFVILGRKLYKMKRKARSLELKVTVDDKKVSQFMSRAARLNEAFSVVRRVPIVRPMLPAAGVNPWPVMNMR